MTAGRPWYLYWVESDGIEDCFVIARNSRSARSIEYHMNGFEFSEVQATKIMRIPTPVEVSYRKSRKHKEYPWPEYAAEKDFFNALGAQFRTIDDCEEMLLEDVVYGVEEYAPGGIYKIRTIGIKAIEELRKALKRDLKYDDEDIWKGPVIHLITALGICLVRCQQIEHYISQSFLFGISKKQKTKYQTVNHLRAGWKKKTLGNMLQSIEEAWEVHPLVKQSFELFLQNRNALIHGIATDERFDLRTVWGQRELLAFLNFFDVHSRMVKKAFRASYYASLHFGVHHWGVPDGVSKDPFTKKQKKEMELFFVYFSPKYDNI